MDLKNFAHAGAPEICALVDGDHNLVPDLILLLLRKFEDFLDRYAQPGVEWEVPDAADLATANGESRPARSTGGSVSQWAERHRIVTHGPLRKGVMRPTNHDALLGGTHGHMELSVGAAYYSFIRSSDRVKLRWR